MFFHWIVEIFGNSTSTSAPARVEGMYNDVVKYSRISYSIPLLFLKIIRTEKIGIMSVTSSHRNLNVIL